MKEQFDETQNRLKYGEPQNDLIARKFAISEERGVIFCIDNIDRYSTRYHSEAEKAKNEADIKKILDYIHRAISVVENNMYFLLLHDIRFRIVENRPFNEVLQELDRLVTKNINK